MNPILQQLNTRQNNQPQSSNPVTPEIVNQARQVMQNPGKLNTILNVLGGRSVEATVRQLAAQRGVDLNDIFNAINGSNKVV